MISTHNSSIVHWSPNFDPISGEFTYDLWRADGIMEGYGFKSYSAMMDYVERARLILDNFI